MKEFILVVLELINSFCLCFGIMEMSNIIYSLKEIGYL